MTPHAARSDWTIARARFGRWIAGVFCAAGLLGAAITHALGAPSLRVCADPDNMPFSNDKGEGFENKLAALIAEQLGRKLDYSWFAEKTGYVPNTMGKDACDLVMGYAQGTGLIEDTNPYYYASYVLITRADAAELMGVASLSDPRLRTKRIGFFARTPPASILAMQGLNAVRRQPVESGRGDDRGDCVWHARCRYFVGASWRLLRLPRGCPAHGCPVGQREHGTRYVLRHHHGREAE